MVLLENKLPFVIEETSEVIEPYERSGNSHSVTFGYLGMMAQTIEVGGYFYINWYQGFHGEMYAKAMRDIMKDSGMESVSLERIE